MLGILASVMPGGAIRAGAIAGGDIIGGASLGTLASVAGGGATAGGAIGGCALLGMLASAEAVESLCLRRLRFCFSRSRSASRTRCISGCVAFSCLMESSCCVSTTLIILAMMSAALFCAVDILAVASCRPCSWYVSTCIILSAMPLDLVCCGPSSCIVLGVRVSWLDDALPGEAEKRRCGVSSASDSFV